MTSKIYDMAKEIETSITSQRSKDIEMGLRQIPGPRVTSKPFCLCYSLLGFLLMQKPY